MIDKQTALEAGYNELSLNQSIRFTRYVQRVLPLDGFVFWVKASLLAGEVAPFEVDVNGSLHYSTNQEMREDENIAVNSVVFTTSTHVDEMQEINSTSLWVGDIDGIRFSFNRAGKNYKSAGLWHYVGDAIYPVFSTQFIDNINDLNLNDVVCSNSMPLWLAQNQLFPIYPSYLAPTNLKTAYATVHIDNQRAMNAMPVNDSDTGTSHQHLRENVRMTLYGVRHGIAWDFIRQLQIYCNSKDEMGILNMPTVQDERRPQSEVNVIAQKKVINFEINFWESRIRSLAQRLVYSAFPQLYVQGVNYGEPVQDQAYLLSNIMIDDLTAPFIIKDEIV